MVRKIFFIITVIIFAAACNRSGEQQKQPERQLMRENLVGANAILVDKEDQEIKDFISRYGWEMQQTGTGLRYMIYEHGSGERARKDNIAIFHYTLRLITGDIVYSSKNETPAEFIIGQRGVESGLDEAMLLLRKGDKAHLILPSHLAHGVPGDGAKIPRRATLIYDIEVLDFK
jgi:FKBP-type peptidyl-prolyl cis-trans isomerase FkpA